MWYIIYKNNKGGSTMRKELLKGLSEEQIKKVEACKSSEEILSLAKAEGVELNDEQLAAVSGGCGGGKKCPKCGSTNVERRTKDVQLKSGVNAIAYDCKDCKHAWVVY